MIENIRLAFQGIWSHKMRSFLTMLGIIIGIASIISIASTIQGTNEQIKQNLIGAGNNNVDVRLYQGESEYWMDNGLPDNISVISDEQKEQIRSLEGVESATFYNRRGYADGITYRNTSLDSGSVYGVDAEFLKTKGYVNELMGKTADELQKDLVSAKKELFNLRFQNATNQLDNTARIKEVRKNIARIQTIITKKAREVK